MEPPANSDAQRRPSSDEDSSIAAWTRAHINACFKIDLSQKGNARRPKAEKSAPALPRMDDLAALLAGLVKAFVFIVQVAVNIAAEVFTTLLAFFCIASLWKIPALLDCYKSCSFDLDGIWEHRRAVVACFFDLLLDILCVPAVLISFMCVWRIGYSCKIWSGDVGKWRSRAWMQVFYGLLDCACIPALAICICSLVRIYFAIRGCSASTDSHGDDWACAWRFEVWRQTGLLLLDILCLPALLLCIASLVRVYFLFKGCERDADNFDWSFKWRTEVCRQTVLLFVDVLCLPALLLCIASLVRIPFLYNGCKPRDEQPKFDWSSTWRTEVWNQLGLLLFDVMFVPFLILCCATFWRLQFLSPSSSVSPSADDWKWNWRRDCFRQSCLGFLDILCFLPLGFSVLSWRHKFFFSGYHARQALQKKNAEAAAAADAQKDIRPKEEPFLDDWSVDWRSECLEQTLSLIQDVACIPFLVIMIVGLWRIPFFLAGSRSRPQKQHKVTKCNDHDWAFAYRSELLRQICFFALDLFFIFPVIFCIMSIWRIKFVKKMYEQELQDMESSSNKSDFPGQIRLRCLQQVIYLFLDILTIPCILLLLVSFWRWGYIVRGLQSSSSGDSSSGSQGWVYDWAGDRRTFLVYQARCLSFDLLCAPVVLFLAVCPWRLYMFWVGLQSRDVLDTVCAGLLPADVITDHPSGWRFKALKCFVFMMKDILAAPFLLFSVATWRNPFFRRAYLAKTLLTLQTINNVSRSTESPKATAAASAQAPLSNPNPDLEISLADAAALSQASPLPAATPSSPAQGQNVSNTELLLMQSPLPGDAPALEHSEQSVAASIEGASSQTPNTVPTVQSPIFSVDTLPWFDPKTLEWHVSWRQLAMVQTALLFLDLLTLPFLVFYLASVYRVCMFPLPISQFLVHEPPFPHKSAFEEDWDAPVRLILVNHSVCILFDILCFPFFFISKISWRGHTLRKPDRFIQPECAPPVSLTNVQSDVENVPQASPALQPVPSASHVDSQLQDQTNFQANSNNDNAIDPNLSLSVCVRGLFLNQVTAY